MPLLAEDWRTASPGSMEVWPIRDRLFVGRMVVIDLEGCSPLQPGSNKDPISGAYFFPNRVSIDQHGCERPQPSSSRLISPASDAIARGVPGGRRSRSNGRLEGWKIGRCETGYSRSDGRY